MKMKIKQISITFYLYNCTDTHTFYFSLLLLFFSLAFYMRDRKIQFCFSVYRYTVHNSLKPFKNCIFIIFYYHTYNNKYIYCKAQRENKKYTTLMMTKDLIFLSFLSVNCFNNVCALSDSLAHSQQTLLSFIDLYKIRIFYNAKSMCHVE